MKLLRALRASNELALFGVLWRADAPLTSAWWGLILLRGLLPAGFALAMGALVSAVQGSHALTGPLVATCTVFLLLQVTGPLHAAAGTNLGARVAGWLHDRLAEACVAPAGIAHLERPDLADDLAVARDFDLGISAPELATCIPNIANGFAEVAGGLVSALVLLHYRWWAPLVAGGAWLSTHLLLKESTVWRARESPTAAQEQRHADYAYRLAVDAPAAKEVRLFGLADWTLARLTARRRALLDLQWQAVRLRQKPVIWCLLLIVAGNVAVFGSLARDAVDGRIGLAALTVYVQVAAGTSALAFGLFDWWLRTAAQPVPAVLRLAQRMAAAGDLPSGGRDAAGLPAHELRFEGVRFGYISSEAPVLDGLDLVIPAGSSLAIVGQNGAGKTTLVKLLCRLYDPQQGSVLADGVDLRELDVASWRARLTAVFQDYVRYELPLRDNVAPLGAPDALVIEALREAGAEGFASLDTVMSRAYPGGADLSGGQWQRVALARALCAVRLGAGVVVLDEPTAQLDVRGEAEVFERILQATRGLTTVLISHRFSTVRQADRICVLEHGRVIEQGTHDELMQQCGRYREMFDLQAARFDAGEVVDAAGA